MAGNNDDNFDLESHKKAFQGFTKLLTYASAAVAVVLALMALFLL
ncbi:aa3-type cytochrome c oxidase subunit IV [Rhodovibrio salinarum]|nr:aa3-type cytochrome c oxidase subunit IV [Rhodovibrio salinarum]